MKLGRRGEVREEVMHEAKKNCKGKRSTKSTQTHLIERLEDVRQELIPQRAKLGRAVGRNVELWREEGGCEAEVFGVTR